MLVNSCIRCCVAVATFFSNHDISLTATSWNPHNLFLVRFRVAAYNTVNAGHKVDSNVRSRRCRKFCTYLVRRDQEFS